MRWRTSGRSANRTTCWMSALPPSSAGCDFPATISWIGLSSSSSSCSSRSGIAQHQRQPLVRRHPPGKPDGQHVRIEGRCDPAQFGFRRAAFQPRLAQPAPDVVDQQRAQLGADPPQVTGVDLLQPQPDAGVAEGVRAGQLTPQLQPLRRRPGARVHPVGDRPDRHLVGVESRPQLVEHRPAHPAVQQRYAVGALRQPQAHVRHVELGRVVFGAERDDPAGRHARQQRGVTVGTGRAADVALHHLQREPVDAGGHRGVGGEHGAGPHHRQRGVEVQPRVGDQLANAFHAEESGVAFVHVEDLGRGQPLDGGERADRPHAADAGQDLLLHPVFLIAAVEAVGDAAQLVLVLGDVGIQQQQRNPADLRDPDPGVQLRGAGKRQLHQHGIAAGVGEQPQRQPLRVQRRVGLVLPAVRGQRLPEVAGAVVEAHGDERNAEVGRGLQVVTGQDAQAARIVGQHLGDAELHRKVRDAGRHGLLVGPVALPLLVPQRTAQVVVQIGRQFVEPAQEGLVERQFVEPRGAHRAEQGDRVAAAALPQRRVDGREQVLRRFVPGPAQVGRELIQRGETLGKVSADSEPAKGFHASLPY